MMEQYERCRRCELSHPQLQQLHRSPLYPCTHICNCRGLICNHCLQSLVRDNPNRCRECEAKWRGLRIVRHAMDYDGFCTEVGQTGFILASIVLCLVMLISIRLLFAKQIQNMSFNERQKFARKGLSMEQAKMRATSSVYSLIASICLPIAVGISFFIFRPMAYAVYQQWYTNRIGPVSFAQVIGLEQQ